MKNINNKIILLAILLVLNNLVSAQNDVSSFVKSGAGEANKLIGAYLKPITTGLASGVNDAWYSTAKPLGTLGFEIKVGFGGSLVREEAKSFTLNSIGANTDAQKSVFLTPIGGNFDSKQPTLVGEGKSSNFLVSTFLKGNGIFPDTTLVLDTLAGFEGTNLPISFGTMPFIQLSVGLVKNTELMIRILPIQSGGFSSSGFGFGVKHSISQWIWGVDKLPIDISGLFSYSNNNLELSFGDDYLKPDGNYPGSKTNEEYKNSQKLSISNSGYQVGLIVSKKLSVFTPYLGVTMNSATSEITMKGLYPVQSVRINGTNQAETYIENFTDPVKISSTVSSLRSAIGFRLKFGPIAFGAEYNHAYNESQFNTFNASLAVNIQQILPLFKL
jgi:hypothetical protein